ncbi:endoplasmic reticulum lectin 1 isoform X2 [Planococcus citri]|uniref:endoplasmic reticulum lectin 1 isoform X2 n=1 Tax=Planococcus citri TaxID=170843 RepID=UPI0031F96C07
MGFPLIYFYFTLILFLHICNSYSTNPFDDTILYNIKWPGRNPEEIADIIDPENYEIGVTDRQERYVCFLPAESKTSDEDGNSQHSTVNPIQLMKPLFDQSTCSYRLETYWAYEICHGKFIKQYHEERDGKKMKRQEYYLGKLDPAIFDGISDAFREARHVDSKLIKTKKIEGMDIPYFQLNYTDGTACDLIDKPRQTNVLYMCFNSGRNDIYSIKEISTCLYEAIIFTPHLCLHPLYRPKNSAEKDINCTPLDQQQARKPAALMAMEAEGMKQKQEQIIDEDQVLKKVFAVFSFDKSENQDGETKLHFHIHPIDVLPEVTKASGKPELPRKPDLAFDVDAFLAGDYCLEDGKGWWKYEFCYGKHVIQFHDQQDNSRTIIKLGEFHEEDHRKWLQENPIRKPYKKTAFPVTHFYSRGSFCHSINGMREVEVRFKCPTGAAVPSSAVKMILAEPQTCKYVLNIESAIFCELNPTVDDYGMFRNIKTTTIEDDHIEL